MNKLLYSLERFSHTDLLTVRQDDKEFFIVPPPDEIAGTENLVQVLRDDLQNRIACLPPILGPKLLQLICLDQDDAEGDVILGKRCEILAKMKLREGMIRHSRGLVGAGCGRHWAAVFLIRFLIVDIEIGDHRNDGAMQVANRGKAHAHGHSVPLLVLEHGLFFGRFAFVQGGDHGTGLATRLIVATPAKSQQSAVMAPNHLMLVEADDAFRALVPKQDFPVAVDDADTGR